MKYKVVQKTRHLIRRHNGFVYVHGEYTYYVYAKDEEEARTIVEEELDDNLVASDVETVSIEQVKEGEENENRKVYRN